MPGTLFQPRPIEIPNTLLLVPWLPDEHRPAAERRRLLSAELLLGDRWAVLTNFMGYPQLLTLLAFVADLPRKRIALLGTAGALDPQVTAPAVVQAATVAAAPPLGAFARHRRLALAPIPDTAWPACRAVTVDWPGRETAAWLAAMRRRRLDVVEMELYPLRAVLGRPFPALLVLSDRLVATGIEPFPRAAVRAELGRAFAWLTRSADETTGNPDPSLPG